MLEIKNITPRKYQEEIFETSKEKNTIIVLPTGTGKTLNALLLAVYRLNKIKNSRIAIVSPTRPLNAQHLKTFKEHTTIDQNEIVLLTGLINQKKRKDLYNKRVIIATPQTLKEDLSNNIFSFKDFSALILDEAHRAIGNYAYTFLTKKYMEESEFPRILALTASPGGNKQKIDEICKNLSIEAVEIRTEEDIKEYIQEKNIRWLNVDLPDSLKKINELIKAVYKERLKGIHNIGFTKPLSLISKKDLISLQNAFRKKLNSNNPSAYYGISLTAALLKIDYASELLETQGINPLLEFWNKLEQDKTKAAISILKTKQIQEAISLTKDLAEKNIKHPKMYMLKGLIRKEIEQNHDAKIIVFANYRNTIDEIVSFLNTEEQIKAIKLIGQKSGLTQKEQISVIKDFEEEKYNTLITSSIGEEGLSIKSATTAVFYDSTPSEIRNIQRAGRVARIQSGKIIFLLTNNTREIGYYFVAKRKENLMKKTLQKMQQKNLENF